MDRKYEKESVKNQQYSRQLKRYEGSYYCLRTVNKTVQSNFVNGILHTASTWNDDVILQHRQPVP